MESEDNDPWSPWSTDGRNCPQAGDPDDKDCEVFAHSPTPPPDSDKTCGHIRSATSAAVKDSSDDDVELVADIDKHGSASCLDGMSQAGVSPPVTLNGIIDSSGSLCDRLLPRLLCRPDSDDLKTNIETRVAQNKVFTSSCSGFGAEALGAANILKDLAEFFQCQTGRVLHCSSCDSSELQRKVLAAHTERTRPLHIFLNVFSFRVMPITRLCSKSTVTRWKSKVF